MLGVVSFVMERLKHQKTKLGVGKEINGFPPTRSITHISIIFFVVAPTLNNLNISTIYELAQNSGQLTPRLLVSQ